MSTHRQRIAPRDSVHCFLEALTTTSAVDSPQTHRPYKSRRSRARVFQGLACPRVSLSVGPFFAAVSFDWKDEIRHWLLISWSHLLIMFNQLSLELLSVALVLQIFLVQYRLRLCGTHGHSRHCRDVHSPWLFPPRCGPGVPSVWPTLSG